jgi:hypothetical protein
MRRNGSIFPSFLASALDRGEWSALSSGRFIPKESAHGAVWIGGWLGPTTGLDSMENINKFPLPGIEPRTSNLKSVAIPAGDKFRPVHEGVWESSGIAAPFLTSALDGDEWSAVWPWRFALGETALDRHWWGSWMGSRAGLDAVQ